jgi:hypothetical protein
MIDKTIQAEIVTPFLIEQNKNPKIGMSGMYIGGGKLAVDSSEADWKKLENLITEKYNIKYAKRNVLTARIEWYTRHRNTASYLKYALIKLNNYPPNITSAGDCAGINSTCFDAFISSTDKKELNNCLKWMEKVIKQFPDRSGAWIDTYANLLYKTGNQKEAIIWQQKAADITKSEAKKNQYLKIVEQMQKGEPTYVQLGAVWTNLK